MLSHRGYDIMNVFNMKKGRIFNFLVVFSLIVFFDTGSFLNAFSQDVDSIVFEAADLHYKGQVDASIAKFETAVKLDPKNEYAHNQLGILYAKKNRFDEAYKEFATVQNIDSSNTFALKWMGILEFRKGNIDKAFEIFTRITKIDPSNADAYYLLGTVYNFRHNSKKAILYLKKARDVDSDEAATHYRLAQAFHSLGMLSNAQLEYQKAVELRPSFLDAIDKIGWIYYNQGDIPKAIGQFQEILKIDKNNVSAALNLAKIYNDLALKEFQANNIEKAGDYWKKTLRINPGNKAARYYLKKVAIK